MEWVIDSTRNLRDGDVIRPINASGPFARVVMVTDGEVTVEPCSVDGLTGLEDSRLPSRPGCETTFLRNGSLKIPRLRRRELAREIAAA